MLKAFLILACALVALAALPTTDAAEANIIDIEYNAPEVPLREAPVIVEATAEHTATVFFLHGIGERGDDWVKSVVAAANMPYAKFIFPNALQIPLDTQGVEGA
jgi:hypothetical protein